jgi:uncharacterized protein
MSKHAIVHVELPAADPASSSKFYSNLFGWKTEEYPGMNYWSYQPEEGPGGGFNPVSNDNLGQLQVRPGQVIVYIDTDDIEGTLAKAEELGAKQVVARTEIPGMGWYAVFEDPTGNYVGLFTEQAAAAA